MSQSRSAAEDRALKLLGDGLGAEVVASAVGLSVSRISQLLSEDEFSKEVQELRYKNLSKHTEQDNELDEIQGDLTKKFKDMMGWGLTRPMEVLKAMQVISQMPRRGSSAPAHLTNQQTVVTLQMPVQVIQKFEVNQLNQVVKAGQQELITIQSGQMNELLKKATNVQSPQLPAPTAPETVDFRAITAERTS